MREKPSLSAEKLFAGSQPSPRSRSQGWWYPWIFVGFFFLTFGVNGALVYFAMSTWTGLETHYWQRGTAYNAALAGARQQRERGWQVGIDFQAADIK